MELCLRLVFILFVQGGCQAQAECPVPEGAGMLLKLGISCSINVQDFVHYAYDWVCTSVQSQLVKLQKALKPEEFAAAMVNVTNRFDLNF